MKRQPLGKFVAKDANGNEYTISKYKKMRDVTATNDTVRQFTPVGVDLFESDAGGDVFKLGPGHYELTTSPPIQIWSDDPIAQ